LYKKQLSHIISAISTNFGKGLKNGQLKSGYNVWHGVDSEYIVWLTVGD
jgi:hypothetical protein